MVGPISWQKPSKIILKITKKAYVYRILSTYRAIMEIFFVQKKFVLEKKYCESQGFRKNSDLIEKCTWIL